MRAWLYDRLSNYDDLFPLFGVTDADEMKTRVLPRRSQNTLPTSLGGKRPFLIYGLGNATSEALSDPTDPDPAHAERQFFQVWIHDEDKSFVRIDSIIPVLKRALVGETDLVSNLLTIAYLETSQEFNNETYGTNFRYVRFQAMILQGVSIS